MQQRVGDQLPHRRGGEFRDGPPKCLPDDLVRGQPDVDVVDQSLEAGGIALGVLALSQAFGASLATVLDDAHGLPLQPRKIAQIPGEQDGPQIRDVEAARLARRHKTIPLQGVENGGATVRERCAEQVEIRRVVELEQDLLAPDALRRNTVFEVHLIESGGL